MIPKLNIDFPPHRAIKAFTPWIKSIQYTPQVDNTFFLNHARTGLRIALSSLNLPKGSRVGMSMYNCLTVMNAIRVAGYEIEFLDITDDLILDLNDLRAKRDNLSAIIVTHFYGIANDINSIKSIAPNIPIIEDCAHAYGSLFDDGTPIGSKGDFAVFSTGLGKFPSIGDGGILLVNNPSYLPTIAEAISHLHTYSLTEETKMICSGFAKYIAYRPLIYSLLLPLKRKKQQSGSFREMYQHREALMPKYVRYLFNKELPVIKNLQHRQQTLSEQLSNHLSTIEGIYIPKHQSKQRNGFLFPILVKDKSILSNIPLLTKFELTSHFSKSTIWAKEFGYSNNCPNAEKIASDIIVLPCNYKNLLS